MLGLCITLDSNLFCLNQLKLLIDSLVEVVLSFLVFSSLKQGGFVYLFHPCLQLSVCRFSYIDSNSVKRVGLHILSSSLDSS